MIITANKVCPACGGERTPEDGEWRRRLWMGDPRMVCPSCAKKLKAFSGPAVITEARRLKLALEDEAIFDATQGVIVWRRDRVIVSPKALRVGGMKAQTPKKQLRAWKAQKPLLDAMRLKRPVMVRL